MVFSAYRSSIHPPSSGRVVGAMKYRTSHGPRPPPVFTQLASFFSRPGSASCCNDPLILYGRSFIMSLSSKQTDNRRIFRHVSRKTISAGAFPHATRPRHLRTRTSPPVCKLHVALVGWKAQANTPNVGNLPVSWSNLNCLSVPEGRYVIDIPASVPRPGTFHIHMFRIACHSPRPPAACRFFHSIPTSIRVTWVVYTVSRHTRLSQAVCFPISPARRPFPALSARTAAIVVGAHSRESAYKCSHPLNPTPKLSSDHPPPRAPSSRRHRHR
ncbi:hypothetical protein C8Q77DRAFT_463139 [Trametes polyzona]|nr:hypothetical protein C8Q77DRAFT_463139 [Trametes polyzona]